MTKPEVKRLQLGRTDRDEAEILINNYELPLTIDELIEEEYKLYPQILSKAQLMPGTIALQKHANWLYFES